MNLADNYWRRSNFYGIELFLHQGPLFTRRRSTKREWLILDEDSLKLLAYPDEESANNPKRDPLYAVPLTNAVFNIESETTFTFSVV